MMYSNDEIITMYREASDKAKQIDILADLNCCKKSEIEEILVRAGLQIPMRTRQKSNGRNRWTEEMVEQLRRYVMEGLSNLEIGERMGLSAGAISYQISSRGFTELRYADDGEKQEHSNVDEIYIKQLQEQIKDLTERLQKEKYGSDKLREENISMATELAQKEKACEDLREQLRLQTSNQTDDQSKGIILRNIKGLAHLVLCALKSLAEKESTYNEDILDGAVTGVANIIVAIDGKGD